MQPISFVKPSLFLPPSSPCLTRLISRVNHDAIPVCISIRSFQCHRVVLCCPCVSAMAQESWQFEGLDLPVTLQVGYAVKPIDMNGDGRLDIAIVDSKRVFWCENPTWKFM